MSAVILPQRIAVCVRGNWYVQELAVSRGCVDIWRTVAGPFPSEAEAEARIGSGLRRAA